MTYARYAIYFVPRAATELARFGRSWLGHDIETDSATQAGWPQVSGSWRAAPRRYGFHATLKAPFALKPGRDVALLEAAVGRFAESQAPVRLDAGLKVVALGSFVALVPADPPPALADLAFGCVEAFDAFRKPPDDDELARRRAAGLTEAQDALLLRWGYPYVGTEFRFHMTLTGSLEGDDLARALAVAEQAAAPVCGHAIEIADLALCGDPGGRAPFRLVSRHPLRG